VSRVGASWDAEYRAGRYVAEAPLPFAHDILAAVERVGLPPGPGLYVGCGNGRNYVPLVAGGLDLVGLDLSAAALAQLDERLPGRADRLVHGDLSVLPANERFSVVVGIQVFQHGREAEAHAHVAEAARRVLPGGLFCVRVNAAGTDPRYSHRVVERNEDDGFTVEYLDGPKAGLAIHFFAEAELVRLVDGFDPVLPLRLDATAHRPPATGRLLQWEAIWRRPERR
jgi:SAM-dependent methyltransferase